MNIEYNDYESSRRLLIQNEVSSSLHLNGAATGNNSLLTFFII
jgi:hypothetical protein